MIQKKKYASPHAVATLASVLFVMAISSSKADLVDYDVIEQTHGKSFSRAYAFVQQGNYEQAVVEYTKALDSNPKLMDAYMQRAS